jgi:hypothetical protein
MMLPSPPLKPRATQRLSRFTAVLAAARRGKEQVERGCEHSPSPAEPMTFGLIQHSEQAIPTTD